MSDDHSMTVRLKPDIWANLLLYSWRAGVEPDELLSETFRDALPRLRERFPARAVRPHVPNLPAASSLSGPPTSR